MKYTINDIAKLSGVSKATVSRVINNSKPVSNSVREKVMEVIKQTNFQPSQLARSLSNMQTKLIGVILPDFSNPIFSKIIEGIESKAINNGYNIVLCNSRHKEETEINYLDVLMDKEVDGLIYNGFKITDEIRNRLRKFNVPIVMIGIGEAYSEYPIVKIDNFKAAYDATLVLVKNGHKNICMIHGPLNDPFSGNLRLEGFKKVLIENNIEINNNLLIEGNYKVEDGYNAMTTLLKLQNPPTGIFCANDEMAIGVIKCIIDNGFNVPQDFSVIGFDDIEMADKYSPAITTVSQPFIQKGISAMELIIKMINKEDVPAITIHQHKIIIRKTVKQILE